MRQDVCQIELCYSFRVDSLVARQEYRGFAAVCVSYCQDSVVASRGQ